LLLLFSVVLTILYNRVVNLDKFDSARLLLLAAIGTGLISIVWDSVAFTRLLRVGGMEHWMLAANHLAAVHSRKPVAAHGNAIMQECTNARYAHRPDVAVGRVILHSCIVAFVHSCSSDAFRHL